MLFHLFHPRTMAFPLPRLTRRVALLLSTGMLLLAGGSIRAQDAPEMPEPPKPPVFATLFPHPSGLNGYEDWALASDLIRNNKMADEATDPEATLTFKRRVLADPTVQQALDLMRTGLSKPSQSPHLMMDENTMLPELAQFRKLARLLGTQIYVNFADGRIDAAIDNLDLGLRFGHRVQTNTLISGLVGVAIDAIVLKAFAQHLDQLSEHQCNHVLRIVEAWLEWPSPIPALLHQEREFALRALDSKRSDPKALQTLIHPDGSDEADAQAGPVTKEALTTKEILTYLGRRPVDLGATIDQAKADVVVLYDTAIFNLKLPVRDRKPMPEVGDPSLGGKLASLLTVNIDQVTSKYDRNEAMVRLLGVHAAIRRYRWEHSSLPATLSELHLGRLNLDPFTGASLFYQRAGKNYELYSQGPLQQTDTGKPLPARAPVRLAPGQ